MPVKDSAPHTMSRQPRVPVDVLANPWRLPTDGVVIPCVYIYD